MSSSAAEKSAESPVDVVCTGIPRRLVLVMAVTASLAVANNYYAQPLLATIARHFNVSQGAAALLVTVSQVGYALGLIAIVPLGDLLERRRLLTFLLSILVFALIAAALSPSLGVLAAASLFIGLMSVIAQVIVPFAASLAAEHERGRVVGTVMGGLLIGILLARTVSGFVGDFFGWRAIYMLAAVLMLVLVVVLRRELPEYRERHVFSYPQLLRSVWQLVREERVLRYRSLYGACVFAAFSVFWTTAAFLLSGLPYQYSDRIIGLFGLLGVAGALAAFAAGRLADRGWARPQTAVFLLCTLVSWFPIFLGANDLVPLVLGIVLMDLGVHATQITNQSEIYRLSPSARSRITTAYMTAYFVGGSGGSLAGALTYEAFGWSGVCCAGAAFVVIALAAWTTEGRSAKAIDD